MGHEDRALFQNEKDRDENFYNVVIPSEKEEEEERFISNNNYIFTQIIKVRIVYTIGKRGTNKKC